MFSSSMDFSLIVAIGCATGVVLTVLSNRQKQQTARSRLLEKALESPNVDRGTLETLAFQLTGRRPVRTPERTGRGVAWLLAIGWFTLFVGGGLLIGGANTHDSELSTAGWIVGLIGLAFVTFPFALRELEARRAVE
ncbi:MAG: hypothetical protein U1E73_06550 [Planctomycetota bacterium]